MPSQESTWVWTTLSKIWEVTARELDALARSYKTKLFIDGQDPRELTIEW
jgi:hypothetical protein